MFHFKKSQATRFFQERSRLHINIIEEVGTCWQSFFTVQHILLCCPFRIVKRTLYNSSQHALSYKLVTWLPQKVICGILASVNLLCWVQYYVRKKIPEGQAKPSEYLQLLSEINLGILKMSILKIYWFGQDEIVNFLNYLPTKISSHFQICSVKYYPNLTKYKFMLSLWCVTVPALVIIEMICWIKELNEAEMTWTTSMLNLGRKAFFLEYFTPEMPPNQTLSLAQSSFSVFILLSHINQAIFYANLPLIMFLQLITLWSLVKTFTDKLNSSENEKLTQSVNSVTFRVTLFAKVCTPKPLGWQGVSNEYESLHHIATMINKKFGLTFSSFVVHMVLYYSTKINEFLFISHGTSKTLKMINFFLNCLSTCINCLLCGDICNKVRH